MHSMTQEPPLVIGGVDAHADAHHFAALDERGALLGSARFAATRAGYAAALGWLGGHGRVDRVAVESTGSYAAGLVRHLRAHEVAVVEVNQPHRHARRRRGKSDPIDAELAARALLAGTARAVPKQTDGVVEAIRLLRVARQGAVKARSAALGQLGDLIITAPAGLRERLAAPKTRRGQASLCARLRITAADDRRDPAIAAKLALRAIAHRIRTLDHEIAALDRDLNSLVAEAAPRTIQLLGISTGHAGQLLTTAGQNIDRLTSEAAFAGLCGANPIPASSGKTTRHRLNPGGDRDANRALHLAAVVRLRYCPRTRAYAQRRTQEGKSKREIIRCLKRYIAREVYTALRADLAQHQPPLTPPPTPPTIVSIYCGSPASTITRHRT